MIFFYTIINSYPQCLLYGDKAFNMQAWEKFALRVVLLFYLMYKDLKHI